MTERQEEILNKIIQEYIDSARPVSSRLLESKHNLGICPAMVRIEMQRLTDMGFISQPHTSAGRVPTDKGYRFFVNNLLKDEVLKSEDIPEIKNIFKKAKRDVIKLVSQLTKFLAEESSGFIIFDLLEMNLVWKEGWEEILREPEFQEKEVLFEFAGLLDDFEKHIRELRPQAKIKVYIGRESPFKKARNFSIISSKCYIPEKENAVISLVGPKRMDYDRNIALINSLINVFN